MQQILSYYKGKKIFLTGHTGFKGAWLMACFDIAGAKVKGYALSPEYDGLFSLLKPINTAESVIADIRDKKKLQKEIEDFQPDFIFHLAAQPLVRRSYLIPVETFEINVVGTANLLESVQGLQSKCTIIVVTTDKVYDNKEQNIMYKESDVLGGYDPYSASKACTELVVNSFRNSFFNIDSYNEHKKIVVSARAGNVIGGGDWSKDRILPDIIRSLRDEMKISVRNPYAVRPWQYVLEPLRGYLQLGIFADSHPDKCSKSYNFGPLPDDHLTVKELVETAIESWGKGEWTDISNSGEPHEAGLLQLDINLAIDELNWNPKLSAKQAVEWSVNWYKITVERQLEYSFQQIKDYFAL